MITLTRAQRLSLKRKWDQDSQGMTYREFRRTVQPGWGCVMVRWCQMYLGIEGAGPHDGLCHS